MGNKFFVYISCCLVGCVYFFGDIFEDFVFLVKNQVFEFLICLYLVEVFFEEEIYFYIWILLYFDIREFFNVLVLIFEDFKNDK